MTHTLHEAVALHRALLADQRLALNKAGLSDAVIHARLVGWDGEYVTVPVFGGGREIVAMERLSFAGDGTLVTPADGGIPAHLYNEGLLDACPPYVVITEGVGECLVLLSQNSWAVSGAGNGRSVPEETLEAICGVPEVYVCFRHGLESREAACQVAASIPGAKLVSLPESFEPGDGIGTFFAKRRRTHRDFLKLLSEAEPLDEPV